jgi:hypothetical protein
MKITMHHGQTGGGTHVYAEAHESANLQNRLMSFISSMGVASTVWSKNLHSECPGSVLYLIASPGLMVAMLRPLRLEFASALYHVASRGDQR